MLPSCAGEPHTLGITSRSARVLPAGVLGFYQLKCWHFATWSAGVFTSQSIGVVTSQSAGVYQLECWDFYQLNCQGLCDTVVVATWPVSHVLGQTHTSQATG